MSSNSNSLPQETTRRIETTPEDLKARCLQPYHEEGTLEVTILSSRHRRRFKRSIMSKVDRQEKLDIPHGFERCHSGFVCPSCKSCLIRKISVESHSEERHTSCTDTNTTNNDEQIKCSLKTAKIANLLLTALSFDRSTRNSNSPKEASRIVPGVSYCPDCKVHVVVKSNELELLFPNENSEEWLRGSLYVAVDEKEIDALLTSQTHSHQKEYACPYKQPKDFEYDYRHRVATKTMGLKMTKGYTLTEKICDECEMPMMENENQAEECVVCPKLRLKIKRYDETKIKPILKADMHFQGDPGADPISAIIAEARRATEPKIKPKASSLGKILGERAAFGAAVSISRTESTSLASTITPDDQPHQVSLAFSNDLTERSISWDKLLVSGRLLLSKRLHQGWAFSDRNCLGSKCNGTPLMRESDRSDDVCMVCGGSGNGWDGRYAADLPNLENTDGEPNWEERLENGRSLLTQRLQQGWMMTTTNCGGYQCNNTPLIKLGSNPSSCVVCGGSGSGFDGIYEKFRPEEVVNAERELVSQEISHLMSMGWILRDSLCQQCLMPLVSEHEESDDLCILCGKVPSNRLVNRPIAEFNDGLSNEAGRRLKMGWTLPKAPLCINCGGLQMMPPNSSEVNCIMPGCRFTELPAPNDEPNNVLNQNEKYTLVGRGMSNKAAEKFEHVADFDDEVPCDNIQRSQNDDPASFPFNYVGIPHSGEDPSVLSDDISQVRSVASSALGQILERLDNAKYHLKALNNSGADPIECTAKQVEIASLIEKLARAAVDKGWNEHHVD